MTVLLGPDDVLPAPSPYGAVFRTAQSVLDAIVHFYSTQSVDLPDYQYVTFGEVPSDAPLLAVGVTAVRQGNVAGSEPTPEIYAASQFIIEATIYLLREVPSPDEAGTAPSAEALIASGQELLRDAELVRRCIVEGRAHGASGDPGSVQGAPFLRAAFGPIAAVGPEGGLGGLSAPFLLQLA